MRTRRVADFPRPPAVEPVPDQVRVLLGGEVIATTDKAWRVLETTHPPTYYLPMADFRDGALIASARTSYCEWKGLARYYAVHGGARMELDAAWGYPDPNPAFEMLRDHVCVYAGRMDACFVGEEQVTPQPGQFYGGWITAEFVGPFKGTPGTEFW